MNTSIPDTRRKALRTWIINHDDSRVFIVAYIGLAVVLSAFVSLFWLLVVVGLHFVLEYISQRHSGRSGLGVWQAALWELRLDWALIIFAMVIALYMEYAIGVAGLRLAPRLGRAVTAGSRGTVRFAVWTRLIRAVMLSLDDAAQVLRAVISRRGNKPDVSETAAPCVERPFEHREEDEQDVQKTWTTGDYLIGLFFVLSVALLLLTPVLTDHDIHSSFLAMMAELHPWP